MGTSIDCKSPTLAVCSPRHPNTVTFTVRIQIMCFSQGRLPQPGHRPVHHRLPGPGGGLRPLAGSEGGADLCERHADLLHSAWGVQCEILKKRLIIFDSVMLF